MEAKASLQEVIRNIELEMSNRFQESFQVIREEFVDVFAKMFGGGRADLELTDPDNLLETGIEIMAQLPGVSSRRTWGFSAGNGRWRPLPCCLPY